ncbi:uncharacterized protein T069G_10630 [Trichoderma breve]|uniref:Uncharacterized protein n=1 Tax=Trichoderma breve TaxID=2034170 RepID=A0A9W9B387_9HYPO|nr:uncharacterized protein T069G_10630 [Trichoderma breve]KAJ4855072.1 hypothetical protein T069G_10630 [Trichoderma breve]
MADLNDSYHFGASNGLMIDDLLVELQENDPVGDQGLGVLYRGNNFKKSMVHVFEVFDTTQKQILWVWFRHVDKFQESELVDINKITKDDESTALLVHWEARWKKIAFAGLESKATPEGEVLEPNFGTKEGFQAKLNEIPELGHVEVLDTRQDIATGIYLAIVSVTK